MFDYYLEQVYYESRRFKEVFKGDDYDFVPVFKNWPKYGYHGTSRENAAKLLKEKKSVHIDVAFLPKLATMYASLKTDPVLLKIPIELLNKKEIYANYDVGEDGFTYEGKLPKEMTIIEIGKIK